MIAVIFELQPHEGLRDAYLAEAAALAPALRDIAGFISVERFQSLSSPGRLLSLSFWEDEAAVERWRTQGAHREAQAVGRNRLFTDYRLRVAQVRRDYGLIDRAQAPPDSRGVHG